MQVFFSLPLLLCHVTVVTGVAGCHGDRDKDNRPRQNCTAGGFSDIPSGLDPTTEVLLLPVNQLSSLSWSNYKMFPDIYEIDLTTNKTIPSYSGFHAGLNMEQRKSKAYFHRSYNQLPNKSVVNDVMDKLSTIIATKRMPFAFLVGDHPVYVLITLLKAENPNKYRDIVPFLGPFHTQCVMMSAIYKRYKGSELGDVLVAGGVIAEGSVDRALKGKHYKRGLRCLRLMYEALLSQLVKGRLVPNLADETRENLEILRDTSLSKESRAAAHMALEDDADLESLITNLFTQVEASDMADYWRDFLSMTDVLMQNVHAVHICNWDEYVPCMEKPGEDKARAAEMERSALKAVIDLVELTRCGDSLDLEEEVVEELFKFTRHVIYGDKKSSTMAEARAAKWKRMKNRSFTRLPPDADSLRQHCLRANYLAYLVRHPSLKQHPSPLGHGWELIHALLAGSAGVLLLSLRVLRLGSNDLEFLRDGSFSPCPSLTELYLPHNALTSLPDNIFAGLSKLEILDLSSNKITVLPPNLIQPLVAIEALFMEYNKIQVMPDDWFSVKDIPYLFLSANPWLCSCSLGYLNGYLNDYETNVYVRDGAFINGDAESVVCASPERLRGRAEQLGRVADSLSTQHALGRHPALR
ncbi:hypothetical protein NHX12_014466 [Muraenolepis orangiensis]|uniref:LRRCT domain-containing protein n=1 Tax=Muraenolepis orangiensis TaxID=630683 RepID=A0A9Q0I3S1_9TELE|nr:hypothetical protein NHX12_014466 [Muraenolepis orangiensis]